MYVTGRESQPQEVGNSSERRELIGSEFSKEIGSGGAGPSQDTSSQGQVCMPPQS